MWDNREKSKVYHLLSLGVVGHLVVNAVFTIFLLSISTTNYPGGAAISHLHRLAANENYVHLHIDNLAAQTGVSRFTQINGQWRYDKTEHLEPGDSTLYKYTHLIAEAKSKFSPNLKPFANTHDIVETIESFHQIAFNYFSIPPIKIKTKPALFILKRKEDYLDYLDEGAKHEAIKVQTQPQSDEKDEVFEDGSDEEGNDVEEGQSKEPEAEQEVEDVTQSEEEEEEEQEPFESLEGLTVSAEEEVSASPLVEEEIDVPQSPEQDFVDLLDETVEDVKEDVSEVEEDNESEIIIENELTEEEDEDEDGGLVIEATLPNVSEEVEVKSYTRSRRVKNAPETTDKKGKKHKSPEEYENLDKIDVKADDKSKQRKHRKLEDVKELDVRSDKKRERDALKKGAKLEKVDSKALSEEAPPKAARKIRRLDDEVKAKLAQNQAQLHKGGKEKVSAKQSVRTIVTGHIREKIQSRTPVKDKLRNVLDKFKTKRVETAKKSSRGTKQSIKAIIDHERDNEQKEELKLLQRQIFEIIDSNPTILNKEFIKNKIHDVIVKEVQTIDEEPTPAPMPPAQKDKVKQVQRGDKVRSRQSAHDAQEAKQKSKERGRGQRGKSTERAEGDTSTFEARKVLDSEEHIVILDDDDFPEELEDHLGGLDVDEEFHEYDAANQQMDNIMGLISDIINKVEETSVETEEVEEGDVQ